MNRLLLLVIAPILFTSCEKVEILPYDETPIEITNFISTYFSDRPIIQMLKDTDGLELTYDVSLADGFFIEFNRKREVIDIEGVLELPIGVVPSTLYDHVVTNYSDNFIVGWELDDRSQHVALDNGLELEFSLSGEFLRIDN